MDTDLARDRHGQTLAAMTAAAEPLSVGPPPGPCPLALVAVTCAGHVLMGRNRWRGEWELPGGLIEEGETPRRAAVRELAEETGCVLPDSSLVWVAFAVFELVAPRRSELAAVYRADLAQRPPVQASYELPDVAWLDLAATSGQSDIAPLDLAIARLCDDDA